MILLRATQASFNSTESCQTLQDEIRIALLSGSDFTQAQGNDPKDALTGETTDNDQDPNLYLARFGNTDASLPGNWIEVFFDTIPPAVRTLTLHVCPYKPGRTQKNFVICNV